MKIYQIKRCNEIQFKQYMSSVTLINYKSYYFSDRRKYLEMEKTSKTREKNSLKQ